jgi:dipeptidyl aminopeptidase/acylaminoacyl peptidase
MNHVPSVKTYKQDVNDVLTALDLVIKRGLIDPSKVAVVGGSHGGFLTTHLIGQVWIALVLLYS